MNNKLRTRSDDLELLIAVTEFGGFSAAAEALNIQVARISRSVSKIEKELGISILTRTTRRVILTDEGKQFVDAVSLGLQKIEKAEIDIVNRGVLPMGKLRVDAASPFILHQLVPHIKGFKKAYPDIDIELSSNEEFVDLIEKRTDVAIRIGKLEDSTLHTKALGKSPLYIVTSPEYLKNNGLIKTPDDLLKHNLIGFSNVKALNKWPLKGLNMITPTISASNGETIRQLILSGNGIACLSGFMISEDIKSGKLISILESYYMPNTDRELVNAVFYKSSAVSKRISAFIDFIKPKMNLS
ncbi:LysR family transcriptional regulator [Pseudoalteromonas denitrificans]|uniref:Transcriptional regulator, LysR family n=1 Tax=Pseudoalteromonas denitrificans DSM 6059 TaxID=1123010 RepID=A0A1I1RWK7_9GAMM|nr:LysR family transcriptional regulator [Pseudoalteromonas denitrificans]SFD38477.1 transcriptional regulator, LysR family [Pseudoalteromonas denitrificans DSM 6059]